MRRTAGSRSARCCGRNPAATNWSRGSRGSSPRTGGPSRWRGCCSGAPPRRRARRSAARFPCRAPRGKLTGAERLKSAGLPADTVRSDRARRLEPSRRFQRRSRPRRHLDALQATLWTQCARRARGRPSAALDRTTRQPQRGRRAARDRPPALRNGVRAGSAGGGRLPEHAGRDRRTEAKRHHPGGRRDRHPQREPLHQSDQHATAGTAHPAASVAAAAGGSSSGRWAGAPQRC